MSSLRLGRRVLSLRLPPLTAKNALEGPGLSCSSSSALLLGAEGVTPVILNHSIGGGFPATLCTMSQGPKPPPKKTDDVTRSMCTISGCSASKTGVGQAGVLSF